MGESTRFSVIPCLPQKQAKAWTPNPHPGRIALFRIILYLNLLYKLKILRIQVQWIQDDNYGDSIYLCTDAAKLIM